jgi:hypothetical protein
MALKSQVCYSNGKESYLARDGGVFIAHTSKTSRWEDSAHLAVRLQCNSWSERQRGNNYIQIKFLTIGVGGSLTGPGGGQNAINTGASGLTDRWWRSNRHGLFRPPKIFFFGQRFSKVFNRFKFRDHSEIFTDQGEERWCSLIILDNILIRIMNLSKWQL